MTMQYSVAVRDAQNDQFEVQAGTAAILEIRSGAQPANCAAADSGTLLASMTLPSDWMGASSSGVKSKSGTWQDLLANATGTAGHFRIKDSGGTTTHMQGSVTVTGGGGDITLDNTSIATNQPVTISTFAITAGNA